MFTTFFRALILYILVVVTMRLTGKRQVGQLEPFELVVALLIADLAAAPMSDMGMPLIYGVISILTLLIAQVLFSYFTLKSETFRSLLCGNPSILISKGKINEKELSRLRYNLDELLEELRSKGVTHIEDVEAGILETSGHVSVILKPEKAPATPQDLSLAVQNPGLPLPLILDGKINRKNLKKFAKDESWLRNELSRQGYASPKNVLLCTLDELGGMSIHPKRRA